MATIEELTQQALMELLQQNEEGEVQRFLTDQFPGLLPDEAKALVGSVSSPFRRYSKN
jgi:hypothetical protein